MACMSKVLIPPSMIWMRGETCIVVHPPTVSPWVPLLPSITFTYIYIHIYICIYVCVCVFAAWMTTLAVTFPSSINKCFTTVPSIHFKFCLVFFCSQTGPFANSYLQKPHQPLPVHIKFFFYWTIDVSFFLNLDKTNINWKLASALFGEIYY